ncbi:tyrosine-type recombinase/integrase [Rodentibacter caecimuris]|uniref:Integrase n=1 Tax=Rodentibacter caecimuris TaxID=1796644 RepID=A0ABX3KX77_9PAST|nr:integrase [Rodentibacter heylii]
MARPRKRKNQGLPQNLLCRSRTRANGKVVEYYYYVMANGKEKSLGTDKHTAILEAARLNLNQYSSANIATTPMVFARYELEELPKKSKNTQIQYKYMLKKLKEFFCNPPVSLSEIKPLHIRMYLDWRSDKPTAANIEISIFHHIWNKARAWGYTDKACPSEGVEKHKLKKRDVYIEDHIYQKVYSLCDPMMKDIMDIAYLSGQRPIDVMNMHTNHIIDDVLNIVQQKTKEKVRIALKGKLKEILARRATGGYIFLNRNGNKFTRQAITAKFAKLRKLAIRTYPELEKELSEFQLRDLRAKAGTDKSLSTNEDEARKQLGHTSIQMTKRYIRKNKVVDPTRS